MLLFCVLRLLLFCLVPTTTDGCENTIITAKEGQTVEIFNFYIPKTKLKLRGLFHWTPNEVQKIAETVGDSSNKGLTGRYNVSIQTDFTLLVIHNVTQGDAGLYIYSSYPPTINLTVVRLSVTVKGSMVNDTDVHTRISRRGSVLEFNDTGCVAAIIYFKHSNSSTWQFIQEYTPNNYLREQQCFTIYNVTERDEGCYIFFEQNDLAINLQRVQLPDMKLAVKTFDISCVETPPVSNLPLRLEHIYHGNVIRYTEERKNGTLSIPLSPVPYHNNGIYRCSSYNDNNKTRVSQTMTVFYGETEPIRSVTFSQYSFISVVVCFIGIFLFCIISLPMVLLFIMKRRTYVISDVEESPYHYDEIGPINDQVINVPLPLRNIIHPAVIQRRNIREIIDEQILDYEIPIRTQEHYSRVSSDASQIYLQEDRMYLSLPRSIKSVKINQEIEESEQPATPLVINSEEKGSEMTTNQNITILQIEDNTGNFENGHNFPEDCLTMFKVNSLATNIDTDEIKIVDNSDDEENHFTVDNVSLENSDRDESNKTILFRGSTEHLHDRCESFELNTVNTVHRQETQEMYINLRI